MTSPEDRKRVEIELQYWIDSLLFDILTGVIEIKECANKTQ